MRIPIIILFVAAVTGCVTGVPCPEGLGEKGDTCSMLSLPSPRDPLYDFMQMVSFMANPSGENLSEGKVGETKTKKKTKQKHESWARSNDHYITAYESLGGYHGNQRDEKKRD